MEPNTLLQTMFPWRAPVNPYEDHERWPELVGLELELEGVDLVSIPRLQGWEVHNDGSLRNGIEYVTNGPVSGDNLVRALDTYYEHITSFDATPRTSTHIHINMTDADVGTVRSLVAITYVLETGLYDIIGVDRKWAGYSMPLYEMPASRLRDLLSSASNSSTFHRAASTGRNNDRYYGLNVASLARHGTVEFRYFPGGPEREELEEWLEMVVAIKRMAKAVSLQDLSDIENPDMLENLFRRHLPTGLMDKMVAVVTPQRMLEALTSILAIAEVESGLTRTDSLVFLSPELTSFLSRYLNLNEEQQQELQRYSSELGVISLREWRTVYDQIARLGSGTSRGQSFRFLDDVVTLRQRLGVDDDSPEPEFDDEDDFDDEDERW